MTKTWSSLYKAIVRALREKSFKERSGIRGKLQDEPAFNRAPGDRELAVVLEWLARLPDEVLDNIAASFS